MAKVKREKKEGRPLKRTLSFEDAVRNSKGKRKSKPVKEQRLRKSLGARLSVMDDDLLAGKFHNSKGKFDTEKFFERAAPLIKEELGSDFSDDELPNTYVPSARTKKHT